MINHPSRLPRASSDWFPSFVSSIQAKLSPIFLNAVRHVVHADDRDADGTATLVVRIYNGTQVLPMLLFSAM